MTRSTQLDFTFVNTSTITQMRNTLVLSLDKDLTTKQVIDQMDKELRARTKETISNEQVFNFVRKSINNDERK